MGTSHHNGVRVRVSHGIGRQGKYISWDVFIMGASVGAIKCPTGGVYAS